MSSTELSLGRRLTDVIDEYEEKMSQVDAILAEIMAKSNALGKISCIASTYSGISVDFSLHIPSKKTVEKSILSSAWRHIYEGLQIERRSSPSDKKRFTKFFEAPITFNMLNIREVFGDYILNPRENVLRGLAEVFSDLDPSFKSHDRMKIGVKGLPKRVIIANYGGSRWSTGADSITSILNSLAMVQGLPLVEYWEMEIIKADGEAAMNGGEYPNPTRSRYDKDENKVIVPARGVRMKYFDNGNAHLFFSPEALELVNKCLAEYYGEVLPDCYAEDEERPERRASTEVSKDLQYYPTPDKVVKEVLDYHVEYFKGKKFLEPSCGCGRFMDEIRQRGGEVFGIEYDGTRVSEARAKGHNVLRANFLEAEPEPIYDYVVMNPPFYGKHYMKHIRHAVKFLAPGGKLVSILPATVKYDHGLIDKEFQAGKYSRNWLDLPIGSFRESGTNINTGVFHYVKPRS